MKFFDYPLINNLRQALISNPFRVGLALLYGFTLIVWFIREWRWYQHLSSKQREVTRLTELNENLMLRVKMDEDLLFTTVDRLKNATTKSLDTCSSENEGEACQLLPIKDLKDETMQKSIVWPDPVYFTWRSLFQVGGLMTMFMLESYAAYAFHKQSKNTENHNNSEVVTKALLWKVRLFLSRHHPISTITFFTTVFFTACVAWMGFITRSVFVHETMNWLLSFYCASVFSYFFHNFLQLKHYLPTTTESFMQSIRNFHWWVWLISRFFGIVEYDTIITSSTILWFIVSLFCFYPVRYFYYYRRSTCAFDERNHIYFVNTIAHMSFVVIFSYFFYAIAVCLPVLEQKLYRESKKEKEEENHQNSYLIQYITRLLHKLNSFMDTNYYSALIIASAIVNTALFVLRFLYFLWTGKCTWYSWCVSWSFLVSHLVLLIFSLPVLNYLFVRSKVDKTFRNDFIERLSENLARVKGSESKSIEQEQEDAVKEYRLIGEQIFDRAMQKTLLFILFTDVSQLRTEGENNNADNLDVNCLSTVLLYVLQNEGHKFFDPDVNYENQEQDDDSPGITKTKSENKEASAASRENTNENDLHID